MVHRSFTRESKLTVMVDQITLKKLCETITSHINISIIDFHVEIMIMLDDVIRNLQNTILKTA